MHHPTDPSAARTGRHAFAALIVANLFLALGPWMVRLADVGPVAAGFWRLALAVPLLLLLARPGAGGRVRSEWGLLALIVLGRSEEHTSELQSLMRISYAVFCL